MCFSKISSFMYVTKITQCNFSSLNVDNRTEKPLITNNTITVLQLYKCFGNA